MARFNTRFVLPEVLYHGTTMGAILSPKGFTKKLINTDFMRNPRSNNKDFGTGFYTTIDFRQASHWARRKMLDAWEAGVDVRYFPEEDLPAIVRITCIQADAQEEIDVLDFRGECDEWSHYILAHRYRSSLNDCDCYALYGHPHPKIVCGPMADNDTGFVIADFKSNNFQIDIEEHRRWFRDQITQTKDGARRVGLELGDQIAWFGEDLNTFVRYNGYYKISVDRFLENHVNENNYMEEWDFYASR